MKLIKYLLFVIASVVFISSCQKELDFEFDGIAKGSLKKDIFSDECLPNTVNGIYRVDTLLNNTNFIDVQVNITTTGTYDIKSDTINGYSFRGTGNLGIAGINTVRLYGTGKPVASGSNAFTINFDSSSCVVNVIVIGANTGVAVFTLDGAPGTCAGAIVNGTYTAGTALGIDNTVTLTVDVVSAGTYVFGPVDVNGMSFSATGLFSNTGIQTVTLNGTGIPSADGIFNATANTGVSECTFSITVDPLGGGPADYTFNNTAGTCSGATYTGIYDPGVPLTSANVVVVNVTVNTIGTYTITSGTNNGITFSGSGTFTTAGGPQPVALTGTGTPTSSGVYNFTVTAGTSTCTFSITVNADNIDYVPETAFSNWSDKRGTDTVYRQVSPNTIVRLGNTYKIFEAQVLGVPTDSILRRKNGGLYYRLFDQTYGFDNPFAVDGLILDSSLAVNATWDIVLGSNTILGGTPATGLIVAKITAKGAIEVVEGNTYNNVIKVLYTFNYDNGSGNTPYYTEEIWYCRGKGIIYFKTNDVVSSISIIRKTTRIQIF